MEACVITSEEARPRPSSADRGGEMAAFERLYHEHAGRVFAICLRMTADRSRAEDLTQETFLRAWDRLEQFRGDAAFGAWLRRVTINVVLANRRSRSRRQDKERPAPDETRLDHRIDPPHPSSGLDLDAALSRLPEGARTVFVLHDVEGYRHNEIARMLGVATGTSKTQLHRARKLLREALKR